MMVDNVYIVDNGAYTAKVELSKAAAPRVIPNCIMKAKSERRRPFIGDQVEECRDASGLFYLLPFQKGFLINWDVQKTVWDYIFSKECCYGNFSETPLIVTEPYFNFSNIQEAMSEIFFEEYECQSLLRINASCEVKEGLQQMLGARQVYDVSAGDPTLTETTYMLRYCSEIFAHRENVKRILWDDNHNPLLQHCLDSDCSKSLKFGKPLWIRHVFNCPNQQKYLNIDMIQALHSHLHVKQSKQRDLSLSLDSWINNYALQCKLDESDTRHVQSFDKTVSEVPASHLIKNLKNKSSSEIFERMPMEELFDTNDQPINYGLKYFEHETPLLLDSTEQPVNFSLKYLEEMENESDTVEMMFGAGETCYAETDLDQPDEMFNYLKKNPEHCSESKFNHLNYALSFSEELKEYQVEGTPCDYSIATPLSGICSPLYEGEAKVESGKVSPNTVPSKQTEDKKSEVILLETPLMFSRSSSLNSLTSDEPLNDVRSLISDYSRMASGMISPSDLPDSPTQTTAPSVHSFKLQPLPKLRSVFEEKVSIFREESTPIQFSTTSSLSALSFDDNLLNEASNESPHLEPEVASTDGNDDDDILAACINAGMQKCRGFGNVKTPGNPKKIVQSSFKTTEKDMCKITKHISTSKDQASADNVKTYTTEDTSLHISRTTSCSDLSKLPEDSDHADILAECIQAGMPKAIGKSKCNSKKSPKVPLKLSLVKGNSHLHNQAKATTSVVDIHGNSLPLKSGSAVKMCHCNPNLVSPESLSEQITTEAGISQLEVRSDSMAKLSRRSSIESIKEDLTEDPVTLSELLLLEQCISSGMPKKKTR
ncbi:uncharacterized protein LOC128995150 isoform X1 [Macrosteles quadrilineatus]|uniref:uncharacterized protein LOC128995150 isoform X1 n=1 Tax=Macrosteles quadrilineatus TaxID=74068 RepID=UPI0023E113BC|nr:uncharacterized protein LOC128995150 isoform X1 [Macrosteles quadrilineatus]